MNENSIDDLMALMHENVKIEHRNQTTDPVFKTLVGKKKARAALEAWWDGSVGVQMFEVISLYGYDTSFHMQGGIMLGGEDKFRALNLKVWRDKLITKMEWSDEVGFWGQDVGEDDEDEDEDEQEDSVEVEGDEEIVIEDEEGEEMEEDDEGDEEE
jgi:hypothetical protein